MQIMNQSLQQIREAIQKMITISEEELEIFMSQTYIKTFKKQALLSTIHQIPNEIYFINKGILRVFIQLCAFEPLKKSR